ncbi:toxin [Streptomyces sp. NPDC002143]
MRRFADTLIKRIQVPFPAEPNDLLDALVESVAVWRGRNVYLHKAEFPPQTASGLWIQRDTHDDIIIDSRAAPWHQIVIAAHEVWHMKEGDAHLPVSMAGGVDAQPAAARTNFSLVAEQNADQFGMIVGMQLREWSNASAHSVYAAQGDLPGSIAGRIGAALNYRGTHR